MPLQKQLLLMFFTCLFLSTHAQEKPIVSDHLSNIASIIPFQFTENGLGFGLSYERIVDKKGMLSINIPAVVTFNIANSNRIYDYNTGNYNTGKANPMYYTMPGIKYYPTNSYGKIKYAIGLSAVVGSGHISNNLVNINGLNVTEQVQSHFIAGAMLNQSVNVHTGKSIYISIEMGAGYSIINQVGKANKNNVFLIQGGFKIGYRF